MLSETTSKLDYSYHQITNRTALLTATIIIESTNIPSPNKVQIRTVGPGSNMIKTRRVVPKAANNIIYLQTLLDMTDWCTVK